MTEINDIYELREPIKGWPVEGAMSFEEATGMIFGSPYWNIPEDRYIVIDHNETYSLVAVFFEGRASHKKRYLVVNMEFLEHSFRVAAMTET